MLSYQELIHIEKVVTKAWLSVETNTDVTRGLGESMVLYQTDGKIRKINVFLNPLHGPVVTKFDKNVPCCILTNWSYFSIYSPISRDQDSKCYEIHPRFLVGFVLLDLQFLCVCFVDRCLSFSSLFFWSLCCLFFFDIRILITPLVSSNSSYANSLQF